MDAYYQKIERLNTNEFIKNFKSAWYSKTNNYKILANFIGTDDFIVHIMGHSCGLSDRVLLNSIFQSSNCKYIKIYYHDQGNSENDFFEKLLEISRHFKADYKNEMRKKIISFPFCSSLS